MKLTTHLPVSAIMVLGAWLLMVMLNSGCTHQEEKTKSESIITADSSHHFADSVTGEKLSRILVLDSLYKVCDTTHMNGKVYFITEGDELLEEPVFVSRYLNQMVSEADLTPFSYRSDAKDIKDSVSLMTEIFKSQVHVELHQRDTVLWRKFPIRYCIQKSTFDEKKGGYDLVKKSMQQAAADWTGLCNVSFQYVEVADKDPNAYPGQYDFVIRYNPVQKKDALFALAFYPSDPPAKRILNIYPYYWPTRYDKAGIFRHEIGHILGFRHDQADRTGKVPSECLTRYREDPTIPSIPRTPYDRFSVMHYVCGGAGTWQLKFSHNDSLGFDMIYPKHKNNLN